MRLQLLSDLLNVVQLDDVAFVEVAEVVEPNPALLTFANLIGIVLVAFEIGDRPGMNDFALRLMRARERLVARPDVTRQPATLPFLPRSNTCLMIA